MAKGKYQKWIEPDGLLRLQGWARDGLTDEQIAKNMGVSVATLYNWKRDHLEILEALKESKEVADRNVENALYEAALKGNITAQIFWLKNRKPKDWREKPADENVNQNITISVEGFDGYGD